MYVERNRGDNSMNEIQRCTIDELTLRILRTNPTVLNLYVDKFGFAAPELFALLLAPELPDLVFIFLHIILKSICR